MHELIATILSHRTTHANEVAAYRTMRDRFPTWEAVRDAPLADLIAAIRTATYPEVKAPYLSRYLRAYLMRKEKPPLIFCTSYLPKLPCTG